MLQYGRLVRLAKDKHTCLPDPFGGYEENEVLQIWPLYALTLITKLVFYHSLIFANKAGVYSSGVPLSMCIDNLTTSSAIKCYIVESL